MTGPRKPPFLVNPSSPPTPCSQRRGPRFNPWAGSQIPNAATKDLVKLCACRLSRDRLFMAPWTVNCQAPPSVGFPGQQYWCRLPFPTPGDLPDPGIGPASLSSPALAGRFFTTEPPGKCLTMTWCRQINK